MVPYVFNNGEYRYYVMKPVQRAGALPPMFQLAKGTRRQKVGGQWIDLRNEADRAGEEAESLLETAKRESEEELGLTADNLRSAIIDLGGYEYVSETNGRRRAMWLFAAEVKHQDSFPPLDQTPTTGARMWLSLKEFAALGRGDHYTILADIEKNSCGITDKEPSPFARLNPSISATS